MNISIKKNLFILSFFIWIVAAVWLLLTFRKPDLHLVFNKFHTSLFDVFFKYITYLGDGLLIVIICVLILLFNKIGNAIVVFSSYIVTGIITQILKRVFFADALRPVKYFENIADLYIVPYHEPHFYHSFPSGHATTTFAFFLCLSFFTSNRYLQLLCFIGAVVVGYSRVYLSEHFFGDVFAGSLIGVSFTLMLGIYFRKFVGRTWYSTSLFKMIKRKLINENGQAN